MLSRVSCTVSLTTVITSTSESETIAAGREFVQTLKPGAVVALRGDLGAGKTRFVRGMAEGLGHDASLVSSPTYTLANEYDTPDAVCPLIHIDAYRLPAGDDLSSIGWDHMTDGASIIVIEWAERVESVLPPAHMNVRIEHTGDTQRLISIEATESGRTP